MCILDGRDRDYYCVFCVHFVALLEAQQLMRDIEELLDKCTSTSPTNQRRRRTVCIVVGERIIREALMEA